jgi:UDP-glucose 4-epimerase
VKILVTGGAGFIGSHIVEHFQEKAEVHVLDNLRSGSWQNLNGLRHAFVEGSILTAMISVPESVQKPIECNEINLGDLRFFSHVVNVDTAKSN